MTSNWLKSHNTTACVSGRAGFWLFAALLLAGCAQTQATSSPPVSAAVGPNTLNVADAAIAGGDPDMALSISQSVLATDSGNVDALVHEGDAYYALDRCPPAEAAYQLALEHDSKATAAETGLGRCLLKTNPQAADAAFSLAVQDDPGNAAAWNDLGIARDLEGNFAGAVNPYQQALLSDPAMTAAEVNLGLSLALSGNGPEALQYLGPLATGQDATPKIREDYAAALVADGRPDEARQVLAVDLPPDEVNTALNGFSALIAQSLPPPPAPSAPPPTVPSAPTAAVTQTPMAQAAAPVPVAAASPAPAPITPAPAPLAPAPLAPAPTAYVPDNSTAAYTGPSPIPVTASSSTPGPVAPAPPVVTASFKAPAPAALPAPAMATPPASTGASVQLGALNTPMAAESAWRNISDGTPALFSGREPEIIPATVDGKTFYRLRLSGFSNTAAAQAFCGKVLATGNACTVADF